MFLQPSSFSRKVTCLTFFFLYCVYQQVLDIIIIFRELRVVPLDLRTMDPHQVLDPVLNPPARVASAEIRCRLAGNQVDPPNRIGRRTLNCMVSVNPGDQRRSLRDIFLPVATPMMVLKRNEGTHFRGLSS